jgi:hypothetical protein
VNEGLRKFSSPLAACWCKEHQRAERTSVQSSKPGGQPRHIGIYGRPLCPIVVESRVPKKRDGTSCKSHMILLSLAQFVTGKAESSTHGSGGHDAPFSDQPSGFRELSTLLS